MWRPGWASPSCCGTERQYRELLEQSGFGLAQVYPAGRFNVIEARSA
ncbi:hypothetical protein [Bradyrhizobium archetypum]|uniref:Uncharacterized protein n=1 Tax=Bradyrhizobium archetypum TaxID=2721160 RepID=A0A7Y4M4P2_9BRAD|nr:hypothetical protein [Bradyrhizobium archetypum]NOJ50023.1 hypothetical protein [Bradyrhizobium archetypum]